MRVVITGSRHFVNAKQVWDELDKLLEEHPDLEIAHGKSPGGGVDLFAEEWAWDRNVSAWPFPVRTAPGGPDGRWPYAGLLRNKRMLLSFMPALVVAFRAPGKSNGTDNCLNEADKLGIDTRTVEEIT